MRLCVMINTCAKNPQAGVARRGGYSSCQQASLRVETPSVSPAVGGWSRYAWTTGALFR